MIRWGNNFNNLPENLMGRQAWKRINEGGLGYVYGVEAKLSGRWDAGGNLPESCGDGGPGGGVKVCGWGRSECW
jgi:hypothetical protein